MDNRYIELDKELKEMYRVWLEDISRQFPELLGKKYSNPYFSSIPNPLFSSTIAPPSCWR